MKIALAQCNYHTGNFEHNIARMLHAINKARTEGAELIVFPELAVCGYPPRDFLEFEDFIDLCENALRILCEESAGMAVVVGAPTRNPDSLGKPLFNSAVVIQEGRITDRVHKVLLPNYDVFDEYRYFEPGPQAHCVTIKGRKVAVTICEDLWNIQEPHLYRRTPMEEMIHEEPEFILNIAASPFSARHPERRSEVLQLNALRYGIPLIYVNHKGAQTELVFDGNSCVLNAQGEIVIQLKAFEEDYTVFQLKDLAEKKPLLSPSLPPSALIHDALVLGIKDYFRKQHFTKAILGLSGGIDSALVAVLAARALGPENVLGLMMPSPYSSDHSITDSEKLAFNLGIQIQKIAIEPAFQAVQTLLEPAFQGLPFNIAEENIQSRLRGLLLMAYTNKFGHILLNTSNKSELAVGYGTLYGDMCGGLSVIGDLYKTEVYALCEWINREQEIIPVNILTKAPSAELRPNQKDSDSLPEYDLLDAVLKGYLEERKSPENLIEAGFDELLVRRVLKLVNSNEYKRHQTPPIIRVSDKAFGQGRRMPIVARYLS